MMVIIKKTENLSGCVKIPPSKSYTHRAVIAAALTKGESKILEPLYSDDTLATINGCKNFGIKIMMNKKMLVVDGSCKLTAPGKPINCKLSATTIRLMTAFASLAEGKTILTGEGSLLKRPIYPLIDALRMLGVKCESTDGFPPVTVYGGGIVGGKSSIVGDVSSQFISALLFICPLAKNDSFIEVKTPLESKPYVELTLEVVKRHGIDIKVLGDHESYYIPSNQNYKPSIHKIFGDFSSASFLIAAAAITNSNVKFKNLYPLVKSQPDVEIVDTLKKMGVKIHCGENYVEVLGGDLNGVEIDAKDTPDLVPVYAVLACYAKGETIIRNVKRLRIKESDRLTTITSELLKMSAQIKVLEDSLIVKGGCRLKGAIINPHNDHRIAMACAVAALGAEGETVILNGDCVKKSYPGFFKDLAKIGGRMEVKC
ncbi:MAG: 3-phosphoshikimate 1-carboxyvinyltransferase [Candidatus Bathyarchaeota archaeon]|nr:3-phosphoshikimate 1-carboxyvinyltransferase [Candidatus Bathyarchaeota archaeon]